MRPHEKWEIVIGQQRRDREPPLGIPVRFEALSVSLSAAVWKKESAAESTDLSRTPAKHRLEVGSELREGELEGFRFRGVVQLND